MTDDTSAEDKEVARQSAKLDLEKKQFDLDQARIKAIADLAPDLTKVTVGKTTATADAAMFQGLLGGRAITRAASNVAGEVARDLGDHLIRVLLTTELDWASREAEYRSFLAQLAALHDRLSEVTVPDPPTPEKPKIVGLALAPAIGIANGVAQLLPGLLSLLSSTKTITTVKDAPIDDQLALFAVAGALRPRATVIVDGTQAVKNDGAAQQAWQAVSEELARIQTALTLHDANPAPAWIKPIQQTVTTTRDVLVSLSTASAGSRVSALLQAAMYEALVAADLEAVVTVKGGAVSATQLLDDRQIRKDLFSVVSSASIAYLAVDLKTDSRVRAGGIAHGEAQAHGVVGSELTIPH